MLIDGQELTAVESSQRIFEKESKRWSISREEFMLLKIFRNTRGFKSSNIFSKGEGIWLSEEIAHELLMVCYCLSLHVDWSL